MNNKEIVEKIKQLIENEQNLMGIMTKQLTDSSPEKNKRDIETINNIMQSIISLSNAEYCLSKTIE